VNKKENQYDQNIPSIDEGWWESVLADEMDGYGMINPLLQRKHEQALDDDPILEPFVTPTGSIIPRLDSDLPVEKEFNHIPGAERTNHQGEWAKNLDQVDWDKACYLYEEDHAVLLTVNGYNRGGLLVEGDGLHGFVPVSHLIDIPCADDETDDWLMDYVNRSLYVKIIECDPARSRIVFSERAALSEPGSRIHLLNRLEPGDCVRGTITNITDFGVFVDLGGVEGLIHVSEISWGRVQHPGDLFQINQQVDVYVIQVDRQRARVALSMKRLRKNPWENASDRYYPGMVTEAVVTSIVPFGAFARLEEGLDGLIHISEINPVKGSNRRIPLREGQQVTVRVLHVDCERQRLGLSLNIYPV